MSQADVNVAGPDMTTLARTGVVVAFYSVIIAPFGALMFLMTAYDDNVRPEMESLALTIGWLLAASIVLVPALYKLAKTCLRKISS